MDIETEIPATQAERLRLLKALADPSRLQIAGLLAARPLCVEEISERLKLSSSTVSFHLRKFEEAELVEKKKNQYYLVYSLRRERLAPRLLDIVMPTRTGGEDPLAKRYREKILRTYVKGGRIPALPKQWRKRRVLLDRFLDLFDVGTTYAEAEVNERIHCLHDDHCTVRRLLIEEGLMTRKGTHYQRTQPKESPMTAPQNRREMVRAYKEKRPEAGLFVVRNLHDGKVLLGSSLNLHGPLNKHRMMLKIGSHLNARLQADWNRLGPEAFSFETVEVIQRPEDPEFDVEAALADRERHWLSFLSPFGAQGYNESSRIRE